MKQSNKLNQVKCLYNVHTLEFDINTHLHAIQQQQLILQSLLQKIHKLILKYFFHENPTWNINYSE